LSHLHLRKKEGSKLRGPVPRGVKKKKRKSGGEEIGEGGNEAPRFQKSAPASRQTKEMVALIKGEEKKKGEGNKKGGNRDQGEFARGPRLEPVVQRRHGRVNQFATVDVHLELIRLKGSAT